MNSKSHSVGRQAFIGYMYTRLPKPGGEDHSRKGALTEKGYQFILIRKQLPNLVLRVLLALQQNRLPLSKISVGFIEVKMGFQVLK